MGEFEDKINSVLNNPQEMEKIMNLARNFMGGSESDDGGPPPSPGGDSGSLDIGSMLGSLDPGLLSKLAGGLASGVGQIALLEAITPHLKEERKTQLRRAITIAQVVKVARTVFSDTGGGDG